MFNKSTNFFMIAIVAIVISISTVPVNAADSALFFVNQPQDMVFADMNKILNFCDNYYREMGILNTNDVDRFYDALRNHGAPQAGNGKAMVAMVVQDGQQNGKGVPSGVLVVYGEFDKAEVINILKKRYTEHMTKNSHSPEFTETANKGGLVHKFLMPEKNRELTILSFGKYCLFSSAAKGDVSLLNETIKCLVKKDISTKNSLEATVKYHIAPTDTDKKRLNKIIDKKFQAFMEDKLKTSRRRGLKRFIVGKVSDYKVKFVMSAVNELETADVNVYRMKNDSANMKRMSLVTNFDDKGKARKVKRKLLKHLNKIVKSATTPEAKLGLSSNIRITSQGNTVTVETQLGTEEEQLHAFAIISSYIASSMLRN